MRAVADLRLIKIVKEVIWLHTPAKVRKMSVCAFIDELQVMASKIGLTMTRNDLQKTIIITSNKLAL